MPNYEITSSEHAVEFDGLAPIPENFAFSQFGILAQSDNSFVLRTRHLACREFLSPLSPGWPIKVLFDTHCGCCQGKDLT